MADAPRGSAEWRDRDRRAHRSVKRRLRNLLDRPTRTGDVYVPPVWVQVVDGQEFRVPVGYMLPQLGARPGRFFNYFLTPVTGE